MESESQAPPGNTPAAVPENLEAVIKAAVETTISSLLNKRFRKHIRDRSRSRGRRSRSGSRDRSGSRERCDESCRTRKRCRSGSGGRRGDRPGRYSMYDWEGFGPFKHHYFHHPPPWRCFEDDGWDLHFRRGKWGKRGRRFYRDDFTNEADTEYNKNVDKPVEKEKTPAGDKDLNNDFENLDVTDTD